MSSSSTAPPPLISAKWRVRLWVHDPSSACTFQQCFRIMIYKWKNCSSTAQRVGYIKHHSSFEYEFPQFKTNRKMHNVINTFLVPKTEYGRINAREIFLELIVSKRKQNIGHPFQLNSSNVNDASWLLCDLFSWSSLFLINLILLIKEKKCERCIN